MDAYAAAAKPLQSARRFRARYLILVGLAVYAGFIMLIGWREVGAVWSTADLPLLLGAAFLLAAGNAIRAVKWRYALGPAQSAVGMFFLSKISAEWTPGRLGEFSPMVLKRHRNAGMGAWIVVDRIIEIVVTLILGILGLAFLRILSLPAWLAVTAVVALIPIAACGALLLTNRLDALRDRFDIGSFRRRCLEISGAVAAAAKSYTAKLPVLGALTIIPKCSDLIAVCLLFKAFGYDIGFALAATAKCALAIVAFIPVTPLATGLPHLTQAGIIHHVAGIPPEGLAAVIGVEVALVSLVLWLSGGVVAAAARWRVEAKSVLVESKLGRDPGQSRRTETDSRVT